MSDFEVARKFLEACDGGKGWGECKQYVADNASFVAQSEPLVDIATVEAYCGWADNFGNVIAPGASFDLHASSYDEATRTALFFATFNAKHTGEGGPVPPTGQETHTHYVYCITMDSSGKVEKMVKIWNAPWAMKELGWA